MYLLQYPHHPCVGKQSLIAYKNFYFPRIFEVPVSVQALALFKCSKYLLRTCFLYILS